MRLYHWTSPEHLPDIARDCRLTTVESNVSLLHPHAGPDVVWLTADWSRPPRDGWAHLSRFDKTRIRFTVELPDAEVHRWIAWSRRQLSRAPDARQARAALIMTGGGGHHDWYVIERPIEWDEIVEICDTDTDTVLIK